MSEHGPRTVAFMVVPEDGGESRTFRISYRLLGLIGGFAVTVALLGVFMAASWWYLAARAARVPGLEAELERLTDEVDQVSALSRQLEIIEGRYSQLRSMFGSGGAEEASEVWLPPAATSPRATGTERVRPGPSRPTSWPLSERGFVTQGLLAGTAQDHLGVDIAVPTDSYVRAAGGGTVVDVGEDPVYGRFVVVDHGEGYSSLYAHTARTLVERGQSVRQNEIIALSGSTGQSTAPHLHFEILLDGEAVDPLEMVRQPS